MLILTWLTGLWVSFVSSALKKTAFGSKNKSWIVVYDTRPAVPSQAIDQNSQCTEDYAFFEPTLLFLHRENLFVFCKNSVCLHVFVSAES